MNVAARRALIVLVVGTLLLCGGLGTSVVALVAVQRFASPTTKPDGSKHQVPARDLWAAVASLVEAGDVKDSDELARLVVRLRTNERLSGDDVKAFDAAFPGITKSPRPLTPADAQKLREIGP